MSFLLYPVIFLLGIPVFAGALTLTIRVHGACKRRFSPGTAFIMSLVFLGLLVLPFSAPAFILGTKGWLALAGWYLVLLAIGGKKIWRLWKVMCVLFDGDPSNDNLFDHLFGAADTKKNIAKGQDAVRAAAAAAAANNGGNNSEQTK